MFKLYLDKSLNKSSEIILPTTMFEMERRYGSYGNRRRRVLENSTAYPDFPLPEMKKVLPEVVLTGQSVNQLSFLACRLDGLTEEELMIFNSAIAMKRPETLVDLINLSCNLDKFSYIPGDLDSVQKESRIDLSKGYIVTESGCVYENAELDAVYDGDRLPYPGYEKNCIFSIWLHTDTYPGKFSLSLPASKEKLEHALRKLRIHSFEECQDMIIRSAIPGLEERLPCENSIEKLNKLAFILQTRALNQEAEERNLFLAALEAEAPFELDQVIEIAEHIKDYQILSEKPISFDHAGCDRKYQEQNACVSTTYGYVRRKDRPIQPLSKGLNTFRLFSPLTGQLYLKNGFGVMEDEPVDIGAEVLCIYKEKITRAIEEELEKMKCERGLADFLDNLLLKQKVYAMTPGVEKWNDRLWGVLEVKTNGELSAGERNAITNEWEGQCSDGFGEDFEQNEIEVDDGILCVRFGQSDQQFFIKSESELKGQSKDQEYSVMNHIN